MCVPAEAVKLLLDLQEKVRGEAGPGELVHAGAHVWTRDWAFLSSVVVLLLLLVLALAVPSAETSDCP